MKNSIKFLLFLSLLICIPIAFAKDLKDLHNYPGQLVQIDVNTKTSDQNIGITANSFILIKVAEYPEEGITAQIERPALQYENQVFAKFLAQKRILHYTSSNTKQYIAAFFKTEPAFQNLTGVEKLLLAKVHYYKDKDDDSNPNTPALHTTAIYIFKK